MCYRRTVCPHDATRTRCPVAANGGACGRPRTEGVNPTHKTGYPGLAARYGSGLGAQRRAAPRKGVDGVSNDKTCRCLCDSVGAKVAVRYAHHKSGRASVVRLGRAAPVYADVGDPYRRIHRLQKVARHLGPDHFRFIMTASAPKLYTMRKPQSDCTKVRTGGVRCSQKKCGITQLDFGQKFNGLAMVRKAKYGACQFL